MHRIHAALLILSFATGVSNAFAYLQLGGVFTANMTGNLVFAGLIRQEHYLDVIWGGSVAILSFVLFTWLGFRMTRSVTLVSTMRVTLLRLMLPALAAQVTIALIWVAADTKLDTPMRLSVLALSAGAMALQTVIARRLSGRAGVTTTFITGMLSGLAQDLAEGRPGNRLLRIGIALAVVAGALSASVLVVSAVLWVPVLQVAVTIIALMLLAFPLRRNFARS